MSSELLIVELHAYPWDGLWWAWAPVLPGFVAQGHDQAEAIERAKDAFARETPEGVSLRFGPHTHDAPPGLLRIGRLEVPNVLWWDPTIEELNIGRGGVADGTPEGHNVWYEIDADEDSEDYIGVMLFAPYGQLIDEGTLAITLPDVGRVALPEAIELLARWAGVHPTPAPGSDAARQLGRRVRELVVACTRGTGLPFHAHPPLVREWYPEEASRLDERQDQSVAASRVTLGPHTFDRVDYDAGADVLYIGGGAVGEDLDDEPTVLMFPADSDRLTGAIVMSARRRLERDGRLQVTLPGGGVADAAPALAVALAQEKFAGSLGWTKVRPGDPPTPPPAGIPDPPERG